MSVNPNESGHGPAAPTPVVRTKLTPPIPGATHLDRPDLVEPLTTPRRLVLISAPAGWGKTSLVAAWNASPAEHRPFAFVRLEPGDDSAPIFWTYVIEAIRTVIPGLMEEARASLRGPRADPMRLIVPALVNELAATDEAVVLVLEDYHVVTDDAIHRSVGHLLDHLPPTVALAIATRSDPPLPLGRLRVSGDMAEVRAAQLAFDADETTAFLAGRFGLDLAAHEIRVLLDRTEGWPAGVQLAGISLEGEPNRTAFVERFAGDDRNVADYLVGEVLASIDPRHREFLLRTSVLNELTGSLCDRLLDRDDSARTLEDLDRSGLFVVPLDHQREWYRYHRLFGDWLRHELRATDSGSIPGLNAEASRWYDEVGRLGPAIEHALAAGDREAAAELIDRYLIDWPNVHWSRVVRWLDQIDDDVVGTHSIAAAAHVWLAMGHGDFAAGVRWLERAEAAAENAPPELRTHVDLIVDVFRAFLELVTGDMEKARLQSLEIVDRERADHSVYYAAALGVAGISTFWSVGALEAIPLLREGAAARADASVNDAGLTPLLALAYAEVGDWVAAEHAAEHALELPSPDEQYEYPHLMFVHYANGLCLVARGERREGIDRLRNGVELARDWVDPIGLAYGCLALADALPDYAEKRALVREARELMSGRWGRGRIIDLIEAAERKLAMRRPAENTAGSVFVEALTERELEVLRLLRSDLSLREVAGELYISHNTVKSYTKSLYRKLGVTSREAALEAASELGLT